MGANHSTDGGIHGVRANQIQNGAYIVINDRPCKVVEASKSKPGKHGHSKCKFQGQDIFTGKKLEMSCPAQRTISAPTIERKDYDLLDILENSSLRLKDIINGHIRVSIQKYNKNFL